MTERKLTPEEIEQLFDFCRKHYVPEYDLQLELVDHLASAIEKQWETNPEIPFPVARIKSFEQFGIFGFSKIKAQKEKELRRKYRQLFWKFTLEFYKLPKVLLTIVLTMVLFMLYRITNNYFGVSVVIFGLIIVIDLFYAFWLFPRKYKIEITDNKPFMLINYLKSRQLGINMLFQVPLQSFGILKNLNYSYLNHPTIAFLTSLAIVTFSILIYVYLFVLPAKIREHFTEQFPQFVKA